MKERTKKLISIALCAGLLVGGLNVTSYAVNKKDDTSAKKEATVQEDQKKAEKKAEEILNDKETVYVFSEANGKVKKVMAGSEVEKGEEAKEKDLAAAKKALPIDMKVSYKLDGKKISAKKLAGKSGHVTICYTYKNKATATVDVNGKKQKVNVPFVVLTGALLDNDVFKNVEVSNGKIVDDGTHTAVAGFALPGLQKNLNLDEEKLKLPESVEINADVENFDMMETATLATNDLFAELDEKKINNSKDLEDSLKKLTGAMDQLMDGSSALYDGLNLLLSKSGDLVKGVGQLTNGADALKEGAGALDGGADALKNGIDQLYAGLSTLESKNGQLTGGGQQVFNTLLATASQQMAEKGLEAPALTMDNYASVLGNVISSLDENAIYAQAEKQVREAVEANRGKIEEGVTQAVRVEVEKKVEAVIRQQIQDKIDQLLKPKAEEPAAEVTEEPAAEVTEEPAAEPSEETTKESVEEPAEKSAAEAVEEPAKEAAEEAAEAVQEKSLPDIIQKPTEAVIKALVKAETDKQMKTPEIQALIKQNIDLTVEKTISEKMASPEIQEKLQAASEGAQNLISLKASLDSYNAFYLGLLTYTQAVTTAKEGAQRLQSGAVVLKDGTVRLTQGSSQLSDGVHQLGSQVPALVDGVTKLKDGSMQLSNGLKDFNEQGIKKITDALNGDVKELISNVKATVKAAKDYKVSADIAEGQAKSTTFIYRVDSIKPAKK